MCIRDSGGGGGNACNVLKAAGGDGFHGSFTVIAAFHKVDKAVGDDVGQMADGGSGIIVLLVVKHHRYRTERSHKLLKVF